MIDVVLDMLYELDQGAEGSAADGLPGDDAEPGFDLVDPRASFRSEVKLHVRMFAEPFVDLSVVVGFQVVEDDVDLCVGRVGLDQPVHEPQEFFGALSAEGLPHDFTIEHVQSCEQVRRAVAHIVMGALLGLAEADRQQRLGPVQRLDLGLLVKAQHHSALGRVQVQANDIDHLGGELRVGGRLERSLPMRFQPMLAPQFGDKLCETLIPSCRFRYFTIS